MRKVICIDDKNLFEGAEVVEGKEYEVEFEFINNWGEKTYLIKGIKNEGLTSKKLKWYGYKASRFATPEKLEETVKEYNYALN